MKYVDSFYPSARDLAFHVPSQSSKRRAAAEKPLDFFIEGRT